MQGRDRGLQVMAQCEFHHGSLAFERPHDDPLEFMESGASTTNHKWNDGIATFPGVNTDIKLCIDSRRYRQSKCSFYAATSWKNARLLPKLLIFWLIDPIKRANKSWQSLVLRKGALIIASEELPVGRAIILVMAARGENLCANQVRSHAFSCYKHIYYARSVGSAGEWHKKVSCHYARWP